jgi:hypothetical protein
MGVLTLYRGNSAEDKQRYSVHSIECGKYSHNHPQFFTVERTVVLTFKECMKE